MTPVCTETPKRAKNPTPEETLKCVPVTSKRQKAADTGHGHVDQVEAGPFGGAEGPVNDHEYEEDREGHDHEQARLGPLLAFVLSQPTDGVALRQLHLLFDLRHRLLDGTAEVAAPDAVLDRHVAPVPLAVDLRRPILCPHRAELRERHPLACWRKEAHLLQSFLRVAVLGKIAHDEVVALLALQHLGEGIAAHGGLDGVLHVGHVDLVAGRGFPVDDEIQVGLAHDAEKAEVLDPFDMPHDLDDLLPLSSSTFRSSP